MLLVAVGELEDNPERPVDVLEEAEMVDANTVTVDAITEVVPNTELNEVVDVCEELARGFRSCGAGACKVSLLGKAQSRTPDP